VLAEVWPAGYGEEWCPSVWYLRPHLEYCAQFGFSKDGDNLKVSPVKWHEGGQGLENVVYEEMLRELVLFGLRKKRLMAGS